MTEQEYNALYYQLNKERIKEYRKKNKEKMREYNKKYYAKNKKKIQEQRRARLLKKREL
jgi:hypothetical protein